MRLFFLTAVVEQPEEKGLFCKFKFEVIMFVQLFLFNLYERKNGCRMNKLLDEEIEEDELFWSQDALKEVPNPSLIYFLTFSFFFPFSIFCCAYIFLSFVSEFDS